jgi:hypothetical protein
MQKPYENLLGGVVEDRGYLRADIKDNSQQHSIFTLLNEKAEQSQLEEEAVCLGAINCSIDNGVPYLEGLSSCDRLLFSPWSVTQLSEKMQMGAAGYLKKCLQVNMSDLFVTNINRWLKRNEQKTVIFRIHRPTNTLRAVVSDRYGFFDHVDVMETVNDVLGNTTSLKIDSAFVSPDNMSLRLIDPTKIVIPGLGNNDGSSVGMHIRNGQTGQYCAELEFMVFTFTCSNGLFIGLDQSQVFKRKHFKIQREYFKEEFYRAVEKFPDYIAAVHTMVEKARNLSLHDIFLTSDDMVAFIRKHANLSTEQVEDISAIHTDAWDSSVWGLSGAVTEYAQRTHNTTLQYTLERAAGKMIEEGIRLAA